MKGFLCFVSVVCLIIIATIMVFVALKVLPPKKICPKTIVTSADIKSLENSLHSELVDINAALSKMNATISEIESNQPKIP